MESLLDGVHPQPGALSRSGRGHPSRPASRSFKNHGGALLLAGLVSLRINRRIPQIRDRAAGGTGAGVFRAWAVIPPEIRGIFE